MIFYRKNKYFTIVFIMSFYFLKLIERLDKFSQATALICTIIIIVVKIY